jgi:hypothetical protein
MTNLSVQKMKWKSKHILWERKKSEWTNCWTKNLTTSERPAAAAWWSAVHSESKPNK